MTGQEVVAALLRSLHLAALVSLFGTLLFVAAAMPDANAEGAMRTRRLLLRLARASAACALLGGIAWLLAETAVIAGTRGVAMTLHALPVVALKTQFGQWVLLRLALLMAVLVLPATWPLQR